MSIHNSTVSLNSFRSKPPEVRIENEGGTREETNVSRFKNYLTFSLYASFLALGMTSSVLGPTFVHLTYIFETDIKTFAVSFTSGALGYLCGSFICGLIFDRINAEMQFFLVTFLMGLFVVLCPWAPGTYIYFAFDFMKCFFSGYVDSSGQSYIIYLWTGHRLKEPMMQAMHGIWSVGATISPFIIAPLLVELPTQDEPNDFSENVNITFSETTDLNNKSMSTEVVEKIEGLEKVRYGYGIIGGLVICISLFFLIGFCALGPTCKRHRKTRKTTPATEQKTINNTKTFVVVIMSLQFIFYVANSWYELVPGGFVSTFVLKGLGWEVKKGPLITSVYWGCHGLGRISAIPISYFLSPGTMVALDLAFTALAFTLMLFVPLAGEILMWFSTALAGFSMASAFASMILWTSNYIAITGFIGAFFLMSSSVGGMTSGALTGFLFQNYTHMWVVYVCLIATAVDIVLFVVLKSIVKILKPEGNTQREDMNEVEDILLK